MGSQLYNTFWSKLWLKAGRQTFAILLSFLVFIILFVTMSIMGLTVFFMFRNGILTELSAPTIHGPIFALIISSCVVGTGITAIFSSMPLRPILTVVDACNQVAKGDFNVRLKPSAVYSYDAFSESFNRMVEELSSVEMLRSDFVNNFSHEFKTPIVSLRGFAKLLKDPDLTEEEKNEYLDIIISESDRLSKLAANVLTLTKLEALTIVDTEERFDLTEQIRRSVLLLESRWEEKQLEPVVDLEEITCLGNEDLLGQVWLNLMDNAIKFSPTEGQLFLTLKQREKDILFSVTDEGCGISPEDIKYIYDKFYQGDKSHSTEGNGLGLSIAKKIIDLHGGKVLIESEQGRGTTFSVVLPLPC